MSDSNLAKAREMFMQYGGSHYGMMHDGELEIYEAYGVSEAQEREWLLEYRNNLWAELRQAPTKSDLVSGICDTIKQSREFEALLPLTAFVEGSLGQLDTFSKIRISEELLDTVSIRKRAKELRFLKEYDCLDPVEEELYRKSHTPKIQEEVRRVIRILLESAINSPVSVADHYRASLPEIDGCYSPKELLSRARETLNEFNDDDKPEPRLKLFFETIRLRLFSRWIGNIAVGIGIAMALAFLRFIVSYVQGLLEKPAG